jgi:predicted kinase
MSPNFSQQYCGQKLRQSQKNVVHLLFFIIHLCQKVMELILFIGIPGSGKSTFYTRQFLDTHLRINRDMLRTETREKILIDACLLAKQPFVIDNTNVTAEKRAAYIARAKPARFRVVGYFFNCSVEEALKRNEQRAGKARVPKVAIYAMAKKLEPPQLSEGFDHLYLVKNDFTIAEIPTS